MPLRTPIAALALGLALGQGVPLAAPVAAEGLSGAYLAARQARYDNDFAAAARYFDQAFEADAQIPGMPEQAIVAHLSLGDLDSALTIARELEGRGQASPVAPLVLIVDEVRQGDFAAVAARIEDGRGLGNFGDALVQAWAQFGQGDVTAALAGFGAVARTDGLRNFALYHKALALAAVGDFEGADAIYAGAETGSMLQPTRRGMIAWAQVLSQLERNADAVTLLQETFDLGADSEIEAMVAALETGARLPFTIVTNATEGVAELYYSLGQALADEAGPGYALLLARGAVALAPGHVDALMMTADLLETMAQHDLATTVYRQVPADHPAYVLAELGRAEALRRQDKTDAALEVLNRLSESHDEDPAVQVSLGDLLRQQSYFREAVTAYDRALELYDAENRGRWFVLYARAIAHERLDQWPEAERDFRAALELNPEQPQVLNYLGYSLVEKRIHLDEALDMIERAVKAEPDSGAIVDSLGWALYRLGRYAESVPHMERAAALLPVDPVVNDHLGDVLWAVGRTNEARFQWRRALSFIGSEGALQDVDPDRIRRKLAVGLDAVLEEEGAAPLDAP